ncbi:hypothetical protein CRYUN_Cryun05aG0061500 [Craigia yunnanensis]
MKNKLMMHQMVRDMGREIIHQESLDLGRLSRLWHRDAFDVIREKIGSKRIKCLTLNLQGLLEDKSRRTTARDLKDFPKGLIWLRWHGFPLQSLPTDFDIKRLVVLDMRNNSLKHVWKDTKILNLNHLHDLLKTPNFSGLPSLEKLMLKDCIKLIEVDQSIGCSRLDDVPRELHNMKSLTVLNLDETAMHQSKSWISWLSLKRSKELGFFWASLPCSLVKLSLESCRLSYDVMPSDLNSLPSLKCLNLSRNSLHSLLESIKSLTKLDELLLTSCTKLQAIPKLPVLSNFVGAYMSMSPINVSLSILPCIFSLKRCVIFGCERLTEVQDVLKLEPIENFEAEEIKSLFNMDSIGSNKVQLYNYLTDTKIIVTPQVLHEYGITSTFIPGSEVLIWFEHRTKGSQIAFCLPVPFDPDEKISFFNLYIAFFFVSDQILEFQPSLSIVNETKEIMRTYFSSFIGIPKTNNNTMLWLIQWPAKGFMLEGGDL